MANYAITSYAIEAPKSIIDEFESAYNKLSEYCTHYVYVSDLIEHLSINADDIDKRGYINGIKRNNAETITLYCETAWGEMSEFRKALSEKYGDDIVIYYECIEWGCKVCYSNDINKFHFHNEIFILDCGNELEFNSLADALLDYHDELKDYHEEIKDGEDLEHALRLSLDNKDVHVMQITYQ